MVNSFKSLLIPVRQNEQYASLCDERFHCEDRITMPLKRAIEDINAQGIPFFQHKECLLMEDINLYFLKRSH